MIKDGKNIGVGDTKSPSTVNKGGRPKGAKNRIKKLSNLTDVLQDFIINTMIEESLNLTEVAEKYSKEIGFNAGAINRYASKNSLFFDRLTIAYDCLLRSNMDEIDEVSKALSSKTYMNDDIDWRQKEARHKRRLDALKFKISKLAPILSARFNKIAQVELTANVKHSGVPQVAIINYANTSIPPSPFTSFPATKQELIGSSYDNQTEIK